MHISPQPQVLMQPKSPRLKIPCKFTSVSTGVAFEGVKLMPAKHVQVPRSGKLTVWSLVGHFQVNAVLSQHNSLNNDV